MAPILITTSRRTSNRVRTFIRDLASVLPGSERFNRGSMSKAELVARISEVGASGVIVVSLHQGNPGSVQFYDSTGSIILDTVVESAMLRREVQPSRAIRVTSIRGIYSSREGGKPVELLAGALSQLTGIAVSDDTTQREPSDNALECDITLEGKTSGKILWTWYRTKDGSEIGPRIRIKSVRSGTVD